MAIFGTEGDDFLEVVQASTTSSTAWAATTPSEDLTATTGCTADPPGTCS